MFSPGFCNAVCFAGSVLGKHTLVYYRLFYLWWLKPLIWTLKLSWWFKKKKIFNFFVQTELGKLSPACCLDWLVPIGASSKGKLVSSWEHWPLSFRLQYSGRMFFYKWGEQGPPETIQRHLQPPAVLSETVGRDWYKSASKCPQYSHALLRWWNHILASAILCWETADRAKMNCSGRKAFSFWYLKSYQELKPWFKKNKTKRPPHNQPVDILVRFASVCSFGQWLVLRIFIQPWTSISPY